MFAFGVILGILGLGSAIYGFTQNNSVEAQVSSLFQSGTVNPGTTFIIAGIAAVVIGVLLMVFGRKKHAA